MKYLKIIKLFYQFDFSLLSVELNYSKFFLFSLLSISNKSLFYFEYTNIDKLPKRYIRLQWLWLSDECYVIELKKHTK